MDFEQIIFRYMEQENMIPEEADVAAGVSGGADSVCLLLVLNEYRRIHSFNLNVVHVEHGIRGEESLEDAAFVKELCGRLDIPCRVVHVDAVSWAREKSLTLEEAGRALRYNALKGALPEGGIIALAHNQDDQAETVLLNLARGTGLRGLGGIRPVRKEKGYKMIRPLLCMPRRGIETYLSERGFSWRTDRTNLEDAYARNRIRHQVLPFLKQSVNEKTCEHIAQTARIAAEADEYLSGQARNWITLHANIVTDQAGAYPAGPATDKNGEKAPGGENGCGRNQLPGSFPNSPGERAGLQVSASALKNMQTGPFSR